MVISALLSREPEVLKAIQELNEGLEKATRVAISRRIQLSVPCV